MRRDVPRGMLWQQEARDRFSSGSQSLREGVGRLMLMMAMMRFGAMMMVMMRFGVMMMAMMRFRVMMA